MDGQARQEIKAAKAESSAANSEQQLRFAGNGRLNRQQLEPAISIDSAVYEGVQGAPDPVPSETGPFEVAKHRRAAELDALDSELESRKAELTRVQNELTQSKQAELARVQAHPSLFLRSVIPV